MSWRSRVVWSSGMFLQPQHFQQEARYVERLVASRARAATPHAWGLATLELDESLLAMGRIGIARMDGVLPDGTPFSAPGLDALPQSLEVPADTTHEEICLALPLAREAVEEFNLGDSDADAACRYDAQVLDLRDNTLTRADAEAIQIGRPRWRLARRRDVEHGHAFIAVASVALRRADGAVVLEGEHIPAITALDATGHLSRHALRLHGLIAQRSKQLASRMGQLGHGLSEVADFLMLMVLNRNEPIFAQHARAPHSHPWHFHRDCLRLAGELSTLSTERRTPVEFPAYRHDALRATFEPLIQTLDTLLSAIIVSPVVQIPLVDRKNGFFSASTDPDVVKRSSFVVAANAQIPAEKLRGDFQRLVKLASVADIQRVVMENLPGIALRALPTVPRQLPFHKGYHYFELDRSSDGWRPIEANGHFGLHVPERFPGLELEFWAIQQ
jgi:type VI secretion system protein ImpJ